MKPVDYETFMHQKEEEEEISVNKPVSQPLPPPPTKKKSAFSTPLLVALIFFLFVISFVGVYYSFSSFFEGSFSGPKAQKLEKGNINPIHVDSDFSVYNAKVDSWTPRKEGLIPFGSWILTGSDSQRNIFSTNKEHTVRANTETKFLVESAKPTDNFKTKVTLELQDGNLWIEGAGDVFEVKTPRGLIKGDGNNFQVIVKDNSARIMAWKGKLSFVPVKDPEKPIEIKEGKMLFIDSMDNIIPPPPNLLAIEDKKTDWQNWNLMLKSEDLVGEKPVVAEIIKVEEKKELTEPVPIETVNEPEVAADKKDSVAEKPPMPEPVVKKPELPKIDTKPRIPTFGKNKYPKKNKKGRNNRNARKPGSDPVPGEEAPPPVPDNLLENSHPKGGDPVPPPDSGPANPPAGGQKVHKVHVGPTNNEGTEPPPSSMGSNPPAKGGDEVLDAPVKNRDVLNNKNVTGRKVPPGMGLGEEPKGPAEQ